MSTLDEILQGLGEEEEAAPELSFDERVKAAIELSRKRVGENPDLFDLLLESVRSKADAFDFVVELLEAHKPDLLDGVSETVTGGELILAEIRRLQRFEAEITAAKSEGDRAH